MLPKADLKIDEQTHPPANHWCRSGHVAPVMFRRGGTQSPEEPTRFYEITSAQDPGVKGVYCEICLIISNAMSRGEVQMNKDGKNG